MREVFGDGRADDGLIQRFQFMVYPDIAPTWRNVDRPPDSDAKNRVFEIFKRLAVLDAEHLAAQQPEGDGVPFLRFTPEAQGILDAWRAALEKRLRGDSDEHPVVASHLAKYRSLMPSVALLFHLVTCVGSRHRRARLGRGHRACAGLVLVSRVACPAGLLQRHERPGHGRRGALEEDPRPQTAQPIPGEDCGAARLGGTHRPEGGLWRPGHPLRAALAPTPGDPWR